MQVRLGRRPPAAAREGRLVIYHSWRSRDLGIKSPLNKELSYMYTIVDFIIEACGQCHALVYVEPL